MNRYENCAILVVSCDRYEACWDPFFKLLFQFWPEFDGAIYLGNNHKQYSFEDKNIHIINTGDEKPWCEKVRDMLDAIPERHILFSLEDYFLTHKINDDTVFRAYNFMKNEEDEVGYLRLFTRLRKLKTRKYKDTEYIQIFAKDSYCVNTSISLWEKDVLYTLLHDRYSAWDFEIKNSKAANETNELPAIFLSSSKNEIQQVNGISGGKWLPEAVKALRKNNIEVDTTEFQIMRGKQLFIFRVKRLIKLRPLKRFIKRILCKLGFKKLFMSENY